MLIQEERKNLGFVAVDKGHVSSGCLFMPCPNYCTWSIFLNRLHLCTWWRKVIQGKHYPVKDAPIHDGTSYNSVLVSYTCFGRMWLKHKTDWKIDSQTGWKELAWNTPLAIETHCIVKIRPEENLWTWFRANVKPCAYWSSG